MAIAVEDELVPLEELVLHDAGMEVRAATHALLRPPAHLPRRTGRRSTPGSRPRAAAPDPACGGATCDPGRRDGSGAGGLGDDFFAEGDFSDGFNPGPDGSS